MVSISQRLNRKIVVQVEADSKQECETIADAVQEALEAHGDGRHGRNVSVVILHEEDVFDD